MISESTGKQVDCMTTQKGLNWLLLKTLSFFFCNCLEELINTRQAYDKHNNLTRYRWRVET